MQYLKSSNPFRNIPKRKLDDFLDDIKGKTDDRLALSKIIDAFTRYYNANIPVDYWDREMHNFKGSKTLVDKYNSIVTDIKDSYRKGAKACFAGQHGTGKTYTCACILKRVVEGNKYSALYVNLTDIINVLASRAEDKAAARTTLLEVDFLVIDEFDQRFIGSDNAADLFGRIIEPIIRTRIQNRLPMFLCTNSPDLAGGFTGALEVSIRSLMKVMPVCPVLGEDFRGMVDG